MTNATFRHLFAIDRILFNITKEIPCFRFLVGLSFHNCFVFVAMSTNVFVFVYSFMSILIGIVPFKRLKISNTFFYLVKKMKASEVSYDVS